MSRRITAGCLIAGMLSAVVLSGCRGGGGCADGTCAAPFGPASSYGAPGQAFTAPPQGFTQGGAASPQPPLRPSFSTPGGGSGSRPSSFGGSGSR